MADKVAELVETYDPMAVAGAMLALSLQLYKTGLEPDDFNMMIDTIVDSKDRVRTLQVPNLQ